jgi:hypothetical protein
MRKNQTTSFKKNNDWSSKNLQVNCAKELFSDDCLPDGSVEEAHEVGGGFPVCGGQHHTGPSALALLPADSDPPLNFFVKSRSLYLHIEEVVLHPLVIS